MDEKNIKDYTDEELVKDAGEVVIGTPSGLKAQHAQAELTRRLMESIKQFDKTTSDYTRRLIALTILLFFVAVIQIIITTLGLPFDWLNRILIALSVGAIVAWLIRDLLKKE